MCTEFLDWISAIGDAGSGLGVLIGVFIAYRQLSEWRKQSLAVRKSDLAGELLSAAYDVSDALAGVRSQIEYVPKEKSQDKNYALEAKSKRLQETHEQFQILRKFQIRSKCVFSDPALEDLIDDFFKVRQEVWAALETLKAYSGEAIGDEENRELFFRLRSKTVVGFSAPDILTERVEQNLARLADKLCPYVQLK